MEHSFSIVGQFIPQVLNYFIFVLQMVPVKSIIDLISWKYDLALNISSK